MPQRFLSRLLPLIMLGTLLYVSPCCGEDFTRFTNRQADGVTAELTFAATPLKSMQSIPFVLHLDSAEGTPVTGLTLQCNLTMPAMAMPPNQPKVEGSGPDYHGYAIFTMAGAWQATFTATDSPHEGFELVFNIPEVLMK